MSDRVPAGAFLDCARVEVKTMTPNRAFTPRAEALTEMRKAVNEHEKRLAELEEVLRSRPF